MATNLEALMKKIKVKLRQLAALVATPEPRPSRYVVPEETEQTLRQELLKHYETQYGSGD